jgi:hypothetical protein|tara:strand:+ start:442 stop:639 length:198 start_codon:yes stop_codon:yes gene_type:complete
LLPRVFSGVHPYTVYTAYSIHSTDSGQAHNDSHKFKCLERKRDRKSRKQEEAKRVNVGSIRIEIG